MDIKEIMESIWAALNAALPGPHVDGATWQSWVRPSGVFLPLPDRSADLPDEGSMDAGCPRSL